MITHYIFLNGRNDKGLLLDATVELTANNIPRKVWLEGEYLVTALCGDITFEVLEDLIMHGKATG